MMREKMHALQQWPSLLQTWYADVLPKVNGVAADDPHYSMTVHQKPQHYMNNNNIQLLVNFGWFVVLNFLFVLQELVYI